MSLSSGTVVARTLGARQTMVAMARAFGLPSIEVRDPSGAVAHRTGAMQSMVSSTADVVLSQRARDQLITLSNLLDDLGRKRDEFVEHLIDEIDL